jgi:hypothetical protein
MFIARQRTIVTRISIAAALLAFAVPGCSGGVVADARGTIYWSAGGYLMHYPNNIP